MAGFLSNYSNNKVLDLFFGSTTYTPPATLYMGLSQTTANKTGTVTEPSGGAYARVAVPNNLTSFPAASTGTKSNAIQLNFATPTASWGTITTLFIADAATGGNVLALADLTTPMTITTGTLAPFVAAGALFLSHS